jgi:hypothetical protein
MTWHRLSMNKIWGETHVEDTTHIKDKFKQVKYVYWTMDNVQKTNNGINMPSSQTFRSYVMFIFIIIIMFK